MLPFPLCLHQACLARPGATALQKQHHPAPREAWGHLACVSVMELARMSLSLWDTAVTTGYPSARATLLPQARHQCSACLRGHPARPCVPCSQGATSCPPLQGIALALPQGGRTSAQLPAGIWHALDPCPPKGSSGFSPFLCAGWLFRLVMALVSLPRCLSTGISTL